MLGRRFAQEEKINIRKTWIVLMATEAMYIIASTALSIIFKDSPFYSELYKTILRIASLIVYSIFFRKSFILEKKINRQFNIFYFIAIIASLLLFSFPFLFGKSGFSGNLRILWFLSSFIVGFREEIFYRGIVQTTLNKKYSIKVALIMTSILFLLYHVYVFIYGSWIDLVEIFTWSLIIGIIYLKVRSIIIVSLIHGFYDAIPFITPVLLKGIKYEVGILLLVLSLLIVSIPFISKSRKET